MRHFFPKAITFIISLLWVNNAFGQSDSTILKVAVHAHPPYMIQENNEPKWDGISLQLWRQIAEELHLNYTLVAVEKEQQQQALESGEVDILLMSEVSAEQDSLLSYSHFYHTAKVGIATPQDSSLTSVAAAFFSKRFWQIALMLSVLLLIVGALIYLIERRSNDDNFGGERSILKGIGAGFWWAGVTMTTIGYGDKAPVTFVGRAIALLWMLMAMAVTAVLTASLVSAMGGAVGKEVNVPEELKEMKVAALEHSPASAYLKTKGISFEGFTTVEKAIQALENEEVEVVLANVASLKHGIASQNASGIKVQEKPLPQQHYALAQLRTTAQFKAIDNRLLDIIGTEQWQKTLQHFIPEPSKK